MKSRTRSRSPASIGSNQSSRRWTAASASDCRVGDVVLLLVMAQSPPVCANAGIVWVSAPGDYAILNSNHTPDGTAGYPELRQTTLSERSLIFMMPFACGAAMCGRTNGLRRRLPLGEALRTRIRGNLNQNIEDAIACFEGVCPALTREAFPLEWALAE